jgi:hypothetical protein
MKTKPKRTYTRLSPATWAEIRAHWQTGEPTLEALSARYRVTTRTLQSDFAKHKIVKGSAAKELARAVQKAVFEDNLDDRDTRIRKGREVRSAAFQNATTIQNLIMAQIHEAAKSPTAAFQASAAIKAFSLAAQAMERLQAMTWKALGLERDENTDELPEIVIRDLNDDELDRIRAGNGNGELDDDDLGAELGALAEDDVVTEQG